MSSDIAGDAKCNHWWAKRLNQTGLSLEYFEFSTRKGITVVRPKNSHLISSILSYLFCLLPHIYIPKSLIS